MATSSTASVASGRSAAPAELGPTPWYGEDVARGLVLYGNGGYSVKNSGILTRFGGAPPVRQARSTYFGADAIMTPWVAAGVALAPRP